MLIFVAGAPLAVVLGASEITEEYVYNIPGFIMHQSGKEGHGGVIRSLHIDISEEFNHIVLDRYSNVPDNSLLPWRCHFKFCISHVGRTSKSTVTELFDGMGAGCDLQQGMPNATRLCTTTYQWINLNLQTRRPDQWDDDQVVLARRLNLPTKYTGGGVVTQPRTVPEVAFTYSKEITSKYIDTNGHINYAVYFFGIMDGILKAQELGLLRAFKGVDVRQSHLREVSILYDGEAMEGDTINISVWNAEQDDKEVDAKITKGSNMLTFAMFRFGKLTWKPKL